MDEHRSGDRAREQAMQARARELSRAWLRTPGSGGFDRVGQDAIRDAADVTLRLTRSGAPDDTAAILADVEALAAALVAPPAPPPRWWSPVHPPPPTAADADALVPLLERLDRQRDAMTRQAIMIQTDRARFADAERGLDDALHLIRALAKAVDAAVRELRVTDPARAGALADDAAAALPERERSVLTQVAVNRQAMVTLDLLAANQKTLAAALEQARTATLSALRIAAAARRATAQAVPDGDAIHARRMLEDAVVQARAALHAMAATPGG